MVKKLSRGFTLLELLIVIGLIGILISVATASYITVQKKSRDSRRMSDMKAIQNAFEQYYADKNGLYPTADADVTTTYLPNGIPKDPKDVAPSVYTVTYNSGLDYSACAVLEGTGLPYCVNNLQ